MMLPAAGVIGPQTTEVLLDALLSEKYRTPRMISLVVPVPGVTEFDVAEGTSNPAALHAVTVQMYEMPLLRPVTVIGLAIPLTL